MFYKLVAEEYKQNQTNVQNNDFLPHVSDNNLFIFIMCFWYLYMYDESIWQVVKKCAWKIKIISADESAGD